MSISRRTLLKMMAGGALTATAPAIVRAAQGTPARPLARLDRRIRAAVTDREIGVALRQVDPATGQSHFEIAINADRLYPVASCFKTWLALYYFWQTPRAEWRFDTESDVYDIVVYSNNLLTGSILYRVGERIDVFGNAIEKFNDFLIFDVGMENGLYRWNWEDNAVEELIDPRFHPSLDDRYTEVRGVHYEMDNLFTANDLAGGYSFLLTNQGDPVNGEAIRHTLNLCAIGVPEYPSPIERSFEQPYTGKDGILPADETGLGRVVNDAGILRIGRSTYILSYLCAGEGEYASIEVLKEIAAALRAFEEEIWA